MSDAPFVYRLRVRYHECDGQKVVFNARYAEYVDVAALEFARAVFGAVEPEQGGIDWRLIKQSMEWKAPAVFDDILAVQVQTKCLGTTSFTLRAEVIKASDSSTLVRAETVYVVYDEATASKAAIPEGARADLLAGARGIVVDCSGAY